MVHKETCPQCKGNRYVTVTTATGARKSTRCPHCSGNGYRVRATGGTCICSPHMTHR